MKRFNNSRTIIGLLWVSVFIFMLGFMSACTNVAMSGASMVYNHHSIQKNLSDQYTTMQIYQALNFKTDEFKNANIVIATFNGEVLLAGQVPEPWQKTKAEQIVKALPQINNVYNLLAIASPSSSLTKMSDAWLTTKIKTKIISASDLDATQIKVVTENGTVYLMGILLPEDAEAVAQMASNTEGVHDVVKIFKYINISKTPPTNLASNQNNSDDQKRTQITANTTSNENFLPIKKANT